MKHDFEQLGHTPQSPDLPGKIQQILNEINHKLKALEGVKSLSPIPKAPEESKQLALAAESLKNELPAVIRESILEDADIEKRMLSALSGYPGITPKQARDFVSNLPRNDSMLG